MTLAAALALCAGAPTPAFAASSDALPDPLSIPEQTQQAADAANLAPVTAPANASWEFDSPQITVVLPSSPTPEVAPAPQTPAAPATAQVGTPEPAAPAPVAAPAPIAGSVLDVAYSMVGVPYVSGGTTPSGFDCSGFTQWVYAQVGIALPRTSGEQRYAGTVVPSDQAQPGDLVWSPGHVSIYVGGGQQIDAPKPGKSIAVRDIWQSSAVYIRVA